MDKIKVFFKNKENITLFFLSLALTANSLIFIASKMQRISFLQIKNLGSFTFFNYFILSILIVGTLVFFAQKFDFKKIVEKILLVYLTTEIILLYGIDQLPCLTSNTLCLMLNNILPVVSVIYFIFLGYLIIEYRKKIPSGVSVKFMAWLKKQGWLAISVVLIVFALNLGFGTYHLAQKAVVDEALWTFDRIPKFWNNVLDGEWQKTHVSDKPGITVAITSGVGLLQINPKEYKDFTWTEPNNNQEKTILDMNFVLRFPILLFSALMLFVFYFLLEKLLGKTTAVISIILIGLSPVLLGISTIINPDALLWIFLPLSMLSFFVYKKEDRNAYLYWAGIFLGLSLLTKYVANILYVYFFLLIFLDYIFNKEKYFNSAATYLKRALLDYFSLMFFSLLTFLVLLPAAWVEISRLLEGTISSQAFQKVWPLFLLVIALIVTDIALIKGKIMSAFLNFLSKYKNFLTITIYLVFFLSILLALANTYSGMRWFDFESFLASPKSSYTLGGFSGLFLANFYSLIFGILPLSLLALIFLAAKNIRKKINLDYTGQVAIYLISFILLYYIASSINNVSATVRYQIVIYPIAFILAAIGIRQILDIEKIKKYVPEFLIFLILLISSVYSLIFIKPFYLAYANDLLPQKYVLNLKDMGDGSYEAAQYLNNLPNARDLTIWTDKNGVCTFFIGKKCTGNIGINKDQIAIDYFVVSSGRESRTSKMTLSRFNGGNQEIIRLDKLYGIKNADFYLQIGNRPNNFVKVISSDKINNIN